MTALPPGRLGALAGTLFVSFLVLAGCSSGDSATESATSTTATTVSTSTTSASTDSTGTDASTSTTVEPGFEGRTITIDVTAGEVKTVGCEQAVAKDSTVRLVVTSDTNDDIHVHGYEKEVAITAGTPSVIDFIANLPGVWEIELHGLDTTVCELTVNG